MTRFEAVNQLKDVYRILSGDLDEIVAYGKANPSAFAHRTLIRTHFALIEGLAFQMRQVTLASLEGRGLLIPPEVALLKEERYYLNKKGEPESNDNFQKALPNLLFSIRCYVKNHGAAFTPDLESPGWEAMKQLVQIRNQITHPKSTADLHLTDRQLQYVVDGAAWWKSTMLAMFTACDEADQYWKSKLEGL